MTLPIPHNPNQVIHLLAPSSEVFLATDKLSISVILQLSLFYKVYICYNLDILRLELYKGLMH